MEDLSTNIKQENNIQKKPPFPIISEQIVYKRYICVTDRVVEFPNGDHIKWDIVGHAFNDSNIFVCVFPFDSKTKTVTIIKEYAQATNAMHFGFPCGHFDRHHHKDYLEAAQHELSEESQLKGGKWVDLLPKGHPGVMEVKWCKNRFIPFLVIDPEHDANPLPKDKEEYIEVVRNVPIGKLKELVFNGEMMLHSSQTTFMALNYLEQNHLL